MLDSEKILAATEPLRAQNGKLLLKFAAFQGQAKELRARQAALVASTALAKARIALAPAAAEVFTILQERAHQRAVGVFEALLSAFVSDVFPEETLRIELDLVTERGSPALHIQINNQGNLEDIMDGNGGALTNVVSAGLVYAALSRTSARPLVVMDEPDCWLKPERVPLFTRVLSEASKTMGCQTLLISHHEPALMDTDIHLVELVLKDGQPAALPVSAPRPWADDAETGVRWIELENVRRHAKTRIPLAPGANALIGDNNLGKSTAFSTALRAMAYGEMSDSMINHGADVAIIRLALENRVVLELERRRKPAAGLPKLVYRRYNDGVLVNEGAPTARGSVPEFITSALKVDYVDGLDIQVRNQKQPVFLLNETPSRRAQLLSVGRESGLLQALIERQRLALKRDRDRLRREDDDLNQVNRKLDALEPLAGLATLVEIIGGMEQEVTQAGTTLATAKQVAEQVIRAEQQVARLAAADADSVVVPGAPLIIETSGLRELLGKLPRWVALESLSAMPDAPAEPAIANTKALSEILGNLERAEALAALTTEAGHLDALPAEPALQERVLLIQSGQAVRDGEKDFAKLEKEGEEAVKAVKQAEAALEALMAKLEVCPVCQTPFGCKEPHRIAA